MKTSNGPSQLGQAYLNQPEDVMDTIQRLREIARTLGNLQTTPEQIVLEDDGDIEILPANPDVIYVPVYQPYSAFTQPAPLAPRRVVSFNAGAPVGTWLKHDWDWPNRRVIVWPKENFRPHNWWTQPRADRFQSTHKCQEWCPRARPGQAQFWNSRRQQSASPKAVENRARPTSTGGHPAPPSTRQSSTPRSSRAPSAAKSTAPAAAKK